MSGLLWIIIIFASLFILAQLSRKIFKTDIFLGIFIMIKTRRFIKYLDRFARPKRLLNILSDIGLVLGFGSFGLDYLFRKKLKISQRLGLFILSGLIFSFLYFFALKEILGSNPLISGNFVIFMAILSGILGLAGFTLASLVFSAYDIIIKLFAGKASAACPGVGLVIPGVKMPKVDLLIPWYGWLILIFSAIIHELAHGTMLRTIKAKVKSMGFILAGILPLGAFVEPDEKEMERKKDSSLVRMYTSGPTSNAIIAVIFFIIFLLFAPTVSDLSRSIAMERESSIIIHSIDQNMTVCGSVFESPAYGVLNEGDKLVSINDRPIRNRYDMMNATSIDKENKFVLVNNGEERIEYLKPNDMGRLGFTYDIEFDPDYVIPQKYYWYSTILSVVLWTAVLNFLIATVNFLPTFPFDGGGISRIIFSEYFPKKMSKKKKMKRIARFFGILIVLLLLLNIIPYFF